MANILAYSILDERQQTSGSERQRGDDWVCDCDASVQHAEAAWNVTAAYRSKGQWVAGGSVRWLLEEAMMPPWVHHPDPIALRRLPLCRRRLGEVARPEGGGRRRLPLPTVALSSRGVRRPRNVGASWDADSVTALAKVLSLFPAFPHHPLRYADTITRPRQRSVAAVLFLRCARRGHLPLQSESCGRFISVST